MSGSLYCESSEGSWRYRFEGRAAAVRLVAAAFLVAWVFSVAGDQLSLVLASVAYLGLALISMVRAVVRSGSRSAAESRLILAADLTGLSTAVLVGGAAAGPLLLLYPLVALGHGLNRGWHDQVLAIAGSLVGLTVYLLAGPVAADSMPLWLTATLLTIGVPTYLKLAVSRLQAEHSSTKTDRDAGPRLIANLRHGLRTPLQGVVGACELLRLGSLDREQRRLADTIKQSAWLQLEMVNSALSLAEAELGPDRVPAADFDLHQLIALVTRLAEVPMAGTSARVVADIAPDVPSQMHGSDVYLTRTLLEVLHALARRMPGADLLVRVNATKESEHRVHVIFQIAPREAAAAEPISMQILEEPFFLHLVERLGASIQSIGAAGERGAVIRLGVPLRVCEAPAVRSPADGRSRILVVGETLLARRIERMAASWPAEVDYDTSSARAFARLARAPTDGRRYGAILVQQHHIAMTPDAFLQSLRGEPSLRHIPVFLVGSSPEPDQRAEWLRVGYSAVISEPLDETTVFGALQAARFFAGHREEPLGGDHAPEQFPLRILVAEDNSTNQLLIRQMLEHAGHSVRMVGDGQAALDELSQRGSDFDLAVMDFNMPRLDGLTAIRRYHLTCEQDGRVPVLVLSASDSDELRRDCMAEGVAAVLQKPIDYQTLIASIRAATSETRLVRQVMAAAAASASETPVVDESKLDTLSELDPTNEGLLREIVDAFVRDGGRLNEQIVLAGRSSDLKAIRHAAHALRGTSLEVGAAALAAECARVEQSVGTQRRDTDIASEIAGVSEAFDRASAALHEYLRHRSGVEREK